MAKTKTDKISPARRNRQAQKARRRLWQWVGGGIIVLVILLVIVVAVVQSGQQSADIPGVQVYSNLTFQHITGPVTYPQVPPVGGDHNPVWLNCGIYDQPVPNENAVHSMEHGAVWITYQPTLPQTDVAKLRQLVRGHSYVILSPYPNLPAPVVASGWGVQLQLTGADDPRLPRFITKYEQGPQTREPGGECTGGTGTPIGQ